MTREGNVHKRFCAQLFCRQWDKVAAGDKVRIDIEVCYGGDDVGVFMRFAGEAENIGALFLNAAEGLRGSGE